MSQVNKITSQSAKSYRKEWLFLAIAMACTLPGLYVRIVDSLGMSIPPPEAGAVLLGMTMVGAAFLLAWATDVAQLDISQSLAIAILAIVAVLPEYSVDASFAYRAASDPVQGEYAIANMTGANRMLIGIAWPLVLLLFWFATKRRKSGFEMARENTMEFSFLSLATDYSLVIIVKGLLVTHNGIAGRLDLIDTGVLVAIYLGYLFASARQPQAEPELIGPAAAIATLRKGRRRLVVVGLFIVSAAMIIFAADPFAQDLVLELEAVAGGQLAHPHPCTRTTGSDGLQNDPRPARAARFTGATDLLDRPDQRIDLVPAQRIDLLLVLLQKALGAGENPGFPQPVYVGDFLAPRLRPLRSLSLRRHGPSW